MVGTLGLESGLSSRAKRVGSTRGEPAYHSHSISDWFIAYLDSPDAKLQAESERDLRSQRFGYIPADYLECLWDSMINPEDPEMKEFLRHLSGP